MKVQTIMSQLAAKHPGEAEYLQAVQEVLESIEEVYNQHPEFEQAKIVERMVEPDRIFTFPSMDTSTVLVSPGAISKSSTMSLFSAEALRAVRAAKPSSRDLNKVFFIIVSFYVDTFLFSLQR